MISKLYLETKAGVDILVGSDAKELIEKIEQGDNAHLYKFYEDGGTEVYMAVKNSSIESLKFPKPGTKPENESSDDYYGVTSSELYAKTVTYPEIVSRIIQTQTKAKPSLMDQIKKAMTLATPIVAVAFILFVMAVALKG